MRQLDVGEALMQPSGQGCPGRLWGACGPGSFGAQQALEEAPGMPAGMVERGFPPHLRSLPQGEDYPWRAGAP